MLKDKTHDDEKKYALLKVELCLPFVIICSRIASKRSIRFNNKKYKQQNQFISKILWVFIANISCKSNRTFWQLHVIESLP